MPSAKAASLPAHAFLQEYARTERLFWSGEDPIGRTIRYYFQSPSLEIVGIVGDVRSIGASEPAPPAVFFDQRTFLPPYLPNPTPDSSMIKIDAEVRLRAEAALSKQ